MTKLEKDNIKKAFDDWSKQCIDGNVMPVLLIGIPEKGNLKELLLWRGGDYQPKQIKEFLQAIIERL